MLLRARFFDDWRLSRIDEEVERLSVNSDTSVAVETTTSSSSSDTCTLPRCASAEAIQVSVHLSASSTQDGVASLRL